MDPQPTLRTARLILRPFRPADAPDVRRLAGEREIAATTLRIPHPYDEPMAYDWIRRTDEAYAAGEAITFATTQRAEGTLVGAVGLILDAENRRAELGYWVGKPFWNRGYATEAARAVVGYGFGPLELRRVHACFFAENPASGRVLQKIGMRREGRLRQHVLKWDTFHDVEYWATLREEFVPFEDDAD